jgi:hypothetical protein
VAGIYLSARLQEAVRTKLFNLEPEYWTTVTSDALVNVFSCPRFGSTLTDTEGRASLINDLGQVMTASGWSSLCYASVYDHGAHTNSAASFIRCLRQFRAFQDLLKKRLFT